MDPENLVHSIVEIAKLAGSSILNIYEKGSDFAEVSYKDDNSPLTLADKASNDVICKSLKELTPSIPILSEETLVEWRLRKDWSKYWLVDPLDGTTNYAHGYPFFACSIGLTCENFATYKVNEYMVRKAFYKDKELKELLYTEEEFDLIDTSELSELMNKFADVHADFRDEQMKLISVCPFFVNIFTLCGENAYAFFSKPIVELTNFKTSLLNAG